MKNDIIVSICSITYNHAPYIRQCLEGMLMQKTNFAFEIIINDDCSTDGTTDIIREYAEKYPDLVKPIYHDKNQYQNGVNNMFTKFVFPKAQGRYIALCEGDDYWTDPLKLQKQVDFLESNSDFVICGTNYYRYYQKTGEKVKFYLTNKRELLTADFIESNKLATLTVLIRKELIFQYTNEIVGNLPKFPMGDYPMWIWLSTKGKVYSFEDYTACYRVLEESASHSKNIDKRFEFMLAGIDIVIFFNKILKLGYNNSYLYIKRIKRILSFCFHNKTMKYINYVFKK